MKKLINFNIVFLIFINFCLGQDKVSGYVLDEETNLPINNVAIYDNNSDQIYYSDSDGYFEFIKNKNTVEIVFFIEGYILLSKQLDEDNVNLDIKLSSRVEQLNEVVVRANKKKIFQIRRMKDFMWKIKGYKYWDNILGLRYDEPKRVISSRNASTKERWENIMPMYEAKHGIDDVLEFWQKANFDLRLPTINGQTVAGNCDLCFLKGRKTLNALMKERPDLADWWIAQENRFGNESGATFRSDRPPYIELVEEAKNPKMLDLFEDDSMSCFCHD